MEKEEYVLKCLVCGRWLAPDLTVTIDGVTICDECTIKRVKKEYTKKTKEK